MKQNNYQYKHLLQDFTEDEILDGHGIVVV